MIGRTNAAGGATINGGVELLKVAPGQVIKKGDFVSKSFDVSVGGLHLIDTISISDSYKTSSPSCSSFGNRLFTCIKYQVDYYTRYIRIDAIDVTVNKQFSPVASILILTVQYRNPAALTIYALSSTKVLLVYTDTSSTENALESRVLEISGSSFTVIATNTKVGAPSGFWESTSIPGMITRISEDRFIHKYNRMYQPGQHRGRCYYRQ